MRFFKPGLTFYLAVIGVGVLINAASFASRALQESVSSTMSEPLVASSTPSEPLTQPPKDDVPAQPTLTFSSIEKNGEVYRVRVLGRGWTKNMERTVKFVDDRVRETLSLDPHDACTDNTACASDQVDLLIQVSGTAVPGDHRLLITEGGTGKRGELVVRIPQPAGLPQPVGTPKITLVDPPMATKDVVSIALRGENWGPYAGRTMARAWLLNPDEPQKGTELRVTRNYNDDELYLIAELTEEARAFPPRDYLIYVITNAGQEAAVPFFLIQKPDLSAVLKPTIVLSPSQGPIDSYVVLAGAGFLSRTGGILRLDGIQISPTVMTDESGAFDNVGFIIPKTLAKDTKITVLTRGVHTIEVDAGDGKRASAIFEITEGEGTPVTKKDKEKIAKDEQKQKEELEKDRKDQQKTEKELADAERERAQKMKKKGKKIPKTIAEIDKRIEKLKSARERLEREIRFGESNGRPCIVDLAITFQPGCVTPKPPAEPPKPYAGKQCDPALPRVWQEGCIAPAIPEPAIQYYAPGSAGKPCRKDIAITFQPGCISEAQY